MQNEKEANTASFFHFGKHIRKIRKDLWREVVNAENTPVLWQEFVISGRKHINVM